MSGKQKALGCAVVLAVLTACDGSTEIAGPVMSNGRPAQPDAPVSAQAGRPQGADLADDSKVVKPTGKNRYAMGAN